MQPITVESSVADQLQDLILDSGYTDNFLQDLAVFSSRTLSSDVTVRAGVTVTREKKATTAASSDAEAKELEEIQHGFDEGPCLNAIATQQTTVVHDVNSDQRWPKYFAAAEKHGHRSMLGVPMYIGGRGGAALNLFARQPDFFTEEMVERAEQYAVQAAKALQLAVMVATEKERSADLEAAMESRTSIDVAVGIIMAQNRCSQDEAIGILKRASNAQNVKLREVAEHLVSGVAGGSAQTHFQ